MAEKLAQIVCLKPDGRDPRTVSEMAPLEEQLKRFPKLKDWLGKAKRPRLEIWSDSGQKIDPPEPEKP